MDCKWSPGMCSPDDQVNAIIISDGSVELSLVDRQQTDLMMFMHNA